MDENAYYESVDGVLFTKDMKTLIRFPSNKANTTYAIPSEVVNIDDYAFEYCIKLVNLTIPFGVVNIGDSAFFYCNHLIGTLTIPSSVASIGESAFYYCNRLTGTLAIPSSVTSIGIAAFRYCRGLTDIEVDAENPAYQSIDGALFTKDGKTLIQCPGGYASTYTVPSSVKSILGYAFEYCSSLTAIYVEEGNTVYKSIDGVLFTKSGQTLVQYPGGRSGAYDIPSGVTNIENYAFEYCSGLTGITFPAGVTSIGNNAFINCSGLTGALTIPSGVTSIGAAAFSNCSGLTGELTIPESVADIGDSAFKGCAGLTAINVATGNTAYQSINGVLFTKDGETLIQYSGGKADTAYAVPSDVTSIIRYAFYNCKTLTNITIPASVTEIGDSAFYGCTGITGIAFNGTQAQWNAITKGSNWDYNTGNYIVYLQ